MLELVIPAYNEAARLPRTLRDLRRHLSRTRSLPGRVQVVIVDNASTDATARLAREADSPTLPVRVVRCETPGKGAAVAAGIAATSAPTIGFMDADGATALDALDEGWRRLSLGAHVVIGSRAAVGADTAVRHSRAREVGARAYRACTARVVPGVADTQCGFKLMDGELGRVLFADIRTTGFSFDVELLARARAAGARIDEFPVTWADVPGSTFDPVRHGLGAFLELATIAWRLRGLAATPPAPAVPVLGPLVGGPTVRPVATLAAEA